MLACQPLSNWPIYTGPESRYCPAGERLTLILSLVGLSRNCPSSNKLTLPAPCRLLFAPVMWTSTCSSQSNVTIFCAY